ncbi:MAG: hypothetical protein K0S39_3262, partial [Paenibacillus sp.]|nr:hypothetical protein [Paenibacillus sp.]
MNHLVNAVPKRGFISLLLLSLLLSLSAML